MVEEYLKSGDEMMDLFHDHPSAVTNSMVTSWVVSIILIVVPRWVETTRETSEFMLAGA